MISFSFKQGVKKLELSMRVSTILILLLIIKKHI